ISAGLDYAGVGPEHSLLRDLKRAEYFHVTDVEAVDGSDKLAQWEGILPALESAHAIAWVVKNAEQFGKDDLLVINVSGRGDKDVQQLADWKAERENEER
ncbi:MAG: tryptophan synthase subunit beta, partial [Verrucomicrobia bacterium]|nr:tryptophan synthase subunit beta [Verrucomicrobiota bacterium]